MWLVGAGYWGSKLLASLNKFGVDAEVIDIRNGQSIEDINNQDPVILATPLWQHYAQCCELLQRGHDVYVEKPMAETAQQIQDIANLVDDQLLMVGHIFIHHPQMMIIKDKIINNEIGTIKHIQSQRTNWGIYQTKTDPVLSLGTHDISIVQELTGGAMKVHDVQSWNLSENVQPDRVWFTGTANGVSYDIDVTWLSPVRVRQTVITGTAGQIVWNQDNNTVTTHKNIIKDRRAVKDDNPEVLQYHSSLSPLEAELKHWVDCVKNRTQPKTSWSQALQVAQVIDEIKSCLTSST